jgi:release factor glutamine methyltransferase
VSTLGQALRAARSRLIDALALEPDVAALEAHVLLGQALHKSRAYLLAHPEAMLDAANLAAFEALLQRRLSGEPIAYILGRREFYGLEFAVSPAVLIPRPETELLVELALERIPTRQPTRVLDLGTGSGAIAITLAKLRPQALVTAVEVSPDALAIARHNAARLGISNVRFIASDWFQALDPSSQLDLIVANPPYIAAGDPHLQQGDVRFEPNSALQSGADGLDAIRLIAQEARRFLSPNGWLLLEHGFNQLGSCADILASFGYANIHCQRDLAGQPRVSSAKLS